MTVSCRQPPEAQSSKTLTWQLTEKAVSSSSSTALQPQEQPQEQSDSIGLDLWPASIVLCRYLAAQLQLVAGRELVELGAGQQSTVDRAAIM